MESSNESELRQRWYFDGQKIRSKHDNKCLDWDMSRQFKNRVFMYPCHRGANQNGKLVIKWIIINVTCHFIKMEFLEKLDSKSYILKELYDNYSAKKERINLSLFMDLIFLNCHMNMSDMTVAQRAEVQSRRDAISLNLSKDSDNIFKSCVTAKSNYFNRFLINNVRDDLIVFGDLNHGSLFNTFNDNLKEIGDSSFETEYILNKIYESFDKIKDFYQTHYNTINDNLIKEDREMYNQTISFLNSKNVNITNEISAFESGIQQLNMESLFNSSSSTEELFDGIDDEENKEFKEGISKTDFKQLKNFYNKIDDHFEEVKTQIELTFPNPNLLDYVRFFR